MIQDSLSMPRRLTIWGLAGAGLVILVWLVFLQDSPGHCPGAPAAYGQIRESPATQRAVAFHRLTLRERVAVYQADERCGRPSQLSLDIVTNDRDSTVVRELLSTLGAFRTARDTSVVVELLAHLKCERGFNVEVDSGEFIRLTATIGALREGPSLSRVVAALNRVGGQCRR